MTPHLTAAFICDHEFYTPTPTPSPSAPSPWEPGGDGGE